MLQIDGVALDPDEMMSEAKIESNNISAREIGHGLFNNGTGYTPRLVLDLNNGFEAVIVCYWDEPLEWFLQKKGMEP